MREYCLDCWNKINGMNLNEENVIRSKIPVACSRCGEVRPTVLFYRSDGVISEFIKRESCADEK